MDLAVITDSSSDLSPATTDDLGVGLVKAQVVRQGQLLRDWDQISPIEVLSAQAEGLELQTQPPGVQDFLETYEEYLHHYDRLISLHLSSDLSVSVVRARIAAEQIAPQRVHVVDSRSVSIGLSAQVARAVELIRLGWEEGAILGELERIQRSGLLLFSVADEVHLIRSGRVPRTVLSDLSAPQMAPVLSVQEGRIQLARVVKREGLEASLVSLLAEPLKGRLCRVSFGHTSASPEAVERFKQLLGESPLNLERGRVVQLGAAVTTHLGAGALAVHAYPMVG
ncbi:MAG: DegV family protein [Meiothermus sp.]|nr:DegV family protein [Meiothermus sp.]